MDPSFAIELEWSYRDLLQCEKKTRHIIQFMPNYKPTEVFVPGGFPKHTYNPRESLRLEDEVAEVTDNLCKLVTVTGHTKSGKTVLVRKVIPPESSVWVDGGAISDENDFWDIIVEQLDEYQQCSSGTSEDSESQVGGKASTGASIFVAKGDVEINAAIKSGQGKSNIGTRSRSSRVTALMALAKAGKALVVDDFHYLSKTLQGGIVRALKPLVFDGLPVVIIAIPHRRYDAIKVEKEMTGRILSISIPTWTEEELAYIPCTGFPLLNRNISTELVSKLGSEAIGSPHLMQEFCRAISKSIGTCETEVILSDEELLAIFKRVADTIGRPIFEKLSRGPRQRKDRVRRELADGTNVDIYELVLVGLAHLKPGLSTYEYEDLRAGIRDVSATTAPQLHEITRVLKHMATIASTDESSTPVIDFEESERRLHVTDPFFAFFLRQGDLLKK